MSAFSYIIRTSMKNFFKQQLKKPVLIIVYAAIIGFMFFGMSSGQSAADAIGSPSELWKALALVYFAAQLYGVLRTAMTKGTTVFGLDDVQLLFTAPVKPQSVLLYGVVRQMGKSLLIPLFLLFQIANLRNLLGMHASEIAALFVAMFLLAFISQVIAMSVYALLAENEAARRNIVRVMNVLAIAFVVSGLLQLAGGGGFNAVLSFYANGAWGYLPLMGWLRASLAAAEGGNALISSLLMAASLILALPPLFAVWKKQPDFYEDVLDTTQQKHEITQLAQSGKRHEATVQQLKVRVGRKGLGNGRGASVFFYKQLLEQRRAGMMFLDMWTLINTLIIVAMCYFMGVGGGMNETQESMNAAIYIALGTLVYMQVIFYVSTGQFAVERKRPFLFLTPNGARSKLVMCNMLGAMKASADALIAFLIAGALSGFSLLHAPLAALLCGALSLLFTGAQLLADWLVGDRHSKLLGMMLFFLAVFVLLAPAVALFIVGLGMGTAPAYLLASAYALLAVFVLYLPLGGILHNMNVQD